MRVLVQRVTRTHIADKHSPENRLASIERGLLILCGFAEGDTIVAIDQMAQKIKSLRVFSDSSGKMNLSGEETDAHYLLVSQFTLYADLRYGNRPSFTSAAPKPKAKESYEHFVSSFSRLVGEDRVKHGAFGSDLLVELVNDGPVTVWLDSTDVL